LISPHSLYSSQLSAETRSRWTAAGVESNLLPSEPILLKLMDHVYQASLLREEGEIVRCRVILASPADFRSMPGGGLDPLTTLTFQNRLPLSAHQIRKLAGAAGFNRSLLAVEVDPHDGQLKIWGIVNTGTRWVNRVSAGRKNDVPLPPNLVMQITNPGHLVISSGNTRIFESFGGILQAEGFDPFKSSWLPDRFRSVRETLLQNLAETGDSSATRICDSFMKSAAQSVIRRAIGLIRTRGHGGMLAYICDQEDAQALAAKWFRFRVFFEQDSGTRRFRQLISRLIERLIVIGRSQGMAVVTWTDFQQIMDTEVQELDDAIIEFTHLLADFMSVDGTLVLDRAFRVIGFGAEILGDSHVTEIHRALDLEAERTVVEPADSSGTRHRAAYRLVSGVPDVIALVVSQDGAVRFVANHKDRLTYWPYLP
jgi:hypothetical protein